MLVPILRAAHCRSTHHFFAIDALERIGTERGKRLAELLLKHYARYLKGAKDPDDKFKDFQNHVLHVSQNYWGGAPKACQQWLDKSMQLLNSGQWSEAAYACGVLSHYFTDPVMPLHTGQTERESVVHRPMEWSVCKAYEEIYQGCQFARSPHQLKLTTDSDWISQAVKSSAAISHTHYERLIEIYNLPRGIVDPPRGLTKEARQILSELFDVAIGGWASILMRMAADMQSIPPDCSLTLATVIAGIDMPRAALVRKFSHVAQQQEVKRIFDEYSETGQVVDNLPAEIKVVRREYVVAMREAKAAEQALLEPASTANIAKAQAAVSKPSMPAPQPVLATPAPPRKTAVIEQEPVAEDELEDDDARDNADDEINDEDHDDTDGTAVDEVQVLVSRATQSVESRQREPKPAESPQPALAWDDPLVDAPSIGPKTAKRFAEIGVHTVQQFLETEAASMAEALNTDWIKPELIEDWQDQAQLVCEVPALCGYKAQLLVAIDCRTSDELGDRSVAELHQLLSDFCKTKEAERILRSAAAPAPDEVSRWIVSARQ